MNDARFRTVFKEMRRISQRTEDPNKQSAVAAIGRNVNIRRDNVNIRRDR